ncbi:MAG: hypothetical protein RIF33_11570 [Cyclobacteriaceae bacterium]
MEFAGKGNRRPQLDINIGSINVDNKNPRLVPYLDKPDEATQLDLISVLYENFDTEVVAQSLIENGYFDEEPLIVVPLSRPEDFKFSDYGSVDELSDAIQKLIDLDQIEFTVVEGNRRTSAIKMITDVDLRKKLSIDRFYPKTDNSEIIADISTVPCIIYDKREDVASYLGVRHIAGLLKWEAFAQAAYTADIIQTEINKGNDIGGAIKQVQRVVGDRSDKLRKQYIAYQLFLEARDNLDFNIRPVINKFSLLTVAYNSASIRDYIGVESYSKVDLESELIDSSNHDKFKDLLTWIYGNKETNEPPVLTDSRKITNTLSHVVKSAEAVEYLQKYNDLEGAYERTSGERDFLSKKLTSASRAIQTSLKFAYKYKQDQELLVQVDELEELVNALKNNLSG